MRNKIEKLSEYIKDAKRILITSHRDPDFDAASSVIGLYWILRSLKKSSIDMVLEDAQPLSNDYIEGTDLIAKQPLDKLDKYDLIFLLDANTSNRFSENGLSIDRKQKVVMIDHHASRTDIKTTLEFTFPEKPSTSEIIYEIFNEIVPISSTIAKALLTGIIDDTKNFSIRGVNKQTLKIAYELIEKGANIAEVSEYIKQYDESILNAVKEVLNNLQFDKKYKYSFSYIPRDVYEELRITDLKMDKIMDHFTDFLLGRKGYRWGLVVRPKGSKGTKLSLRSRFKAQNVRIIAEHLGGGGHDEAAGATFEDTHDPYAALALTRKKIEEFLG